MAFASPSEKHPDSSGSSCARSAAADVTTVCREPGHTPKLLSWSCQKIAPPPTTLARVHSRWNRSSPFDLRQPLLRFVPLPSFLPTSAVYSSRDLAGLLHPASGHGVRLVSGASPRPKSRDAAPSPEAWSPFRAFPSAPAVSCHHDHLPSRRLRPSRVHHVSVASPLALTRPQGFTPAPNPLFLRVVSDLPKPDALMGLSQIGFDLAAWRSSSRTRRRDRQNQTPKRRVSTPPLGAVLRRHHQGPSRNRRSQGSRPPTKAETYVREHLVPHRGLDATTHAHATRTRASERGALRIQTRRRPPVPFPK